MTNNRGFIIHKVGYKKGGRHDDNIYKKNHPLKTPKQVINVVDLGYLGIENDVPQQLSSTPIIERKGICCSYYPIIK
jgi:hypothetical protein